MKLNKLLERQLRKYLPNDIASQPGITAFLEAVNDSYYAYEKDSLLSERAFKMSEEEYIEVNEKLQKELELKKVSIEKLKAAIEETGVEGFTMSGDDLVEIVELLNAQINQRKQSEIELKASQELWKFALEGAGDGVWDYDFQTRKIFFSKRYKEMLGYDEHEFANDSDEWMSRIHPEDLHLVMKTDQDYFYKKQANHQVEYRIRHRDGHYIWVLDRGMVVNRTPEGLPGRIIGTHTDITERKLAEHAIIIREEKYRNILANMNLGLLEVDNDEVIQFANQSFCEMSGYALDEIIGKKAGLLFPAGDGKEILDHKNNLRKKGVSDAYELTVTNKKGEPKWWLISGAPTYNDSGQLMGSIGIHLDITDRKKLEFELNDAREVAEQSVRTKEAFLANMSHEIRTPMNAIIGMGRQLEKTDLLDQQRFFLHTINMAADHLLVVINDILDISKIEAGKLELESTAFHPAEVLQHVVRIMQPRAEEKGLELKIDIDANIAPVLIGDAHRINQILLNQISNAIKFTEKGGVTVSGRLQKKVGQTQVIEFRIRDTGIGIAEDFLANIFEKFSQEDRTTARKYGGTGLGMAITKELVELMDGQISINSKKDIGTEIIISLPFEIGSTADLPEQKQDFTNSASLEGVRILLAEDNEMNRLVANTVLENYGVLITEAKNGAEAVKALQKDAYDLVLMDMQMPVMGGLEATVIIRQELKLKLPIIALTANAIKGDSERCLAVGMNGFVSKPFEEHDLINEIAKVLNLDTAKPREGADASAQADKPLFSLAKLEQIGRGDDVFIKRMIDLFLEQTPEAIAEMRDAFKQEDFKAIKLLAHKVKPMIDTLEITLLKEVIREIENFSESPAKKKQLKALIDKFADIMEQVKVAMLS
jgi:PAS domain S-box-containing protein